MKSFVCSHPRNLYDLASIPVAFESLVHVTGCQNTGRLLFDTSEFGPWPNEPIWKARRISCISCPLFILYVAYPSASDKTL